MPASLDLDELIDDMTRMVGIDKLDSQCLYEYLSPGADQPLYHPVTMMRLPAYAYVAGDLLLPKNREGREARHRFHLA